MKFGDRIYTLPSFVGRGHFGHVVDMDDRGKRVYIELDEPYGLRRVVWVRPWEVLVLPGLGWKDGEIE